MIRRPPRSTRKESSAASDVYKRQGLAWSTNTSKTVYYTASGAIDCFEHDFNYISQIAMKLNMPGKYNKIKKNARVIKTEDLPAAKLDTLLESVTDRYDMIKIDAQGTKY